eukprot:Gb_26507 [translate_table: standard]
MTVFTNMFFITRPAISGSYLVSMATTVRIPQALTSYGFLQFLVFFAVSCYFLRLMFSGRKPTLKLPPGPPGWPIVGNLIQIGRSGKPFMSIVKELQAEYGSVFTLQMGQRTLIVVTSSELAHEALIQKGQIFSNRPPETPTRNVFSSNKCTVNSAEYGALWRTLRRNMVSEMLNPARSRDFRWVREWAIDRLLRRLAKEADANEGVIQVLPNCRFAVFCILLCMCFGTQLEEDVIELVDATLKEVLMTLEPRMDDFFPILSPFFAKQRRRVKEVRALQMTNILPLVQSRRRQLTENKGTSAAYIDSLFSLELEGGRKLTDEELVTLCSEFLNGGTDTTAAALEWAMAHLVLDSRVQAKVYEEIVAVVGNKAVEETDVDRMPYLNAVVKETLRRHPPTHFVLSHAVTEPAKLAGYDIPTKANVEFYTAGIGNDPKLWTDPLEFRPERFLEGDADVDITGVKQIKMMPFGAGRRICPGLGVGTLHINLIVGRMVQSFEWLCKPGHEVDLAEQYAFTVIMKNPVQALIKTRNPT